MLWVNQGSIFWSENDIYPPPLFWKLYSYPLLGHIIFWLLSWLFCLNSSLFCIYFTLLLPPPSHFLSPFLFFLLHFSPFSLCLFIFFPPYDIGWYFSPLGGGGYFPIYRPLEVNCDPVPSNSKWYDSRYTSSAALLCGIQFCGPVRFWPGSGCELSTQTGPDSDTT